MEKKNTTILIVAGLILLLSMGVLYFLALPAYKKLGETDSQIKDINNRIEAKNNYYSTVEAKINALNQAGWTDKKKKIEVNFTSSPFFISKTTVFFRTMITGAGMTSSSITAGTPTSVKAAPAQNTQSSTSEVKVSKAGASTEESGSQQQQQTTSASYLDNLKGPVKKTSFNLSVSGTYNSFKKLLSDFENQTRIVTVKSVAVSSSQQDTGKKGSSNLSSFNLVVEVYSY